MPWCETCAKFWNPSSMRADGTCPTCGRSLASAAASAPAGPAEVDGAEAGPGAGADPVPGVGQRLTGADLREMAGEDAKAPWHFKLMVVALAIYLGWRAVDLIMKLVR